MKELKDVSVTVRIPATLSQRLKKVAESRACAFSVVFRETLEKGLEKDAGEDMGMLE